MEHLVEVEDSLSEMLLYACQVDGLAKRDDHSQIFINSFLNIIPSFQNEMFNTIKHLSIVPLCHKTGNVGRGEVKNPKHQPNNKGTLQSLINFSFSRFGIWQIDEKLHSTLKISRWTVVFNEEKMN